MGPVLGVRFIGAKRAASPYRGGVRVFQKVRHSKTTDAAVVGYVGPAARPRRLALRLPDGRTVLSRAVPAHVALEVARHTATSGTGGRARVDDGDEYTTMSAGLVAEVEAGTTRHATVTVTRLR
ncbi:MULTISPECIES: hypothetical protein [unclassified Streptomyces]|uniref:hypothetical protein n=1 Tax=unclassified Streptomyces TaxID=2593676 RepID=UPI000DB96CF1|nr:MULTISPECIES: hypothetical protein [unclassified Streptomyces]MYT68224.1 hypothetical protein [Streptomyces sp. SID8367]RAJ76856.1 hypothetical protein K377_06024 [Streptomyces sp. PsTaAH-137]